jgi:spermidine synthase
MLALIFGSTVYAISTILVAYMAGLSIGSYFGGKFADRIKNPVKLYGICELGIGLFALIFPILLNHINGLYIEFYTLFNPSRVLFSTLRFIILGCLLLIPTSLMGATLPALSKGLTSEIEKVGIISGNLYAINTTGAVCGVAVSAFISIEAVGLRTTSHLAAFFNLAIAFIVLFGLHIKNFSNKNAAQRAFQTSPEQTSFSAKFVLFVYALSGFCALSLEVLWTRELVFFLGSDTYAFGTMLSVFLFGIKIPSFYLEYSKYVSDLRHFLILSLFQNYTSINKICSSTSVIIHFPSFFQDTLYLPFS